MTEYNSASKEKGILGIDAGGTFTDLVFMNGTPLNIFAKIKTPTIHENLIQTIQNGIDLILEKVDKSQIRAVNLATTLATNAIVENKLRTMGVILIGYDKDSVELAKKKGAFGTDIIYIVNGGHDPKGNEVHPLDEGRLKDIANQLRGKVDAVAISGYFSVRNTSHELRAKEIIRRMLPEVHITCGHELATDLDAIKRATTASLNAGLIPIIMELLASVKDVCEKRHIYAPIMVIRGDGSLVSSDWASEHPIEMVLSGPAGSACGACFLADASSKKNGSWVVDIGGTTTDIIHLNEEGRPTLNKEGSTVGNHQTLVKAIDIFTFGLGGDSRIHYDHEKNLKLGPRRIKPLCVAALQYPAMKKEMKEIIDMEVICDPLFAFSGQYSYKAESLFEKKILKKLENGPHLVHNLLENEVRANALLLEIEKMEERGILDFAGMTPTDIFHVIGKMDKWDKEASILGANIMAINNHSSIDSFAHIAYKEAVKTMAYQVFRKSLGIQGYLLTSNGEGEKILNLSLKEEEEHPNHSCLKMNLNAELIGVGAPSWAFSSEVAKYLGEKAILPEGAEVAGAVGAAIGSFSLSYVVVIHPLSQGGFRVHHPLGIVDYDDLEIAVEATRDSMMPWILSRAQKAGAHCPKVTFKRHDENVGVTGRRQKIYLKTQLLFTVLDEGE